MYTKDFSDYKILSLPYSEKTQRWQAKQHLRYAHRIFKSQSDNPITSHTDQEMAAHHAKFLFKENFTIQNPTRHLRYNTSLLTIPKPEDYPYRFHCFTFSRMIRVISGLSRNYKTG